MSEFEAPIAEATKNRCFPVPLLNAGTDARKEVCKFFEHVEQPLSFLILSENPDAMIRFLDQNGRRN